MNVKLKVFLSVAALSVGSLMADPLLYWMVQEGESSVKFQMAQVQVYDNGTASGKYLSLIDENGNESAGVLANGVSVSDSGLSGYGTSTKATWANLSGYNSTQYSFAVELYNLSSSGTWSLVGNGGSPVSYDSLVSQGAVLASSLSVGTSMMAWTVNGVSTGGGGGGGSAVPEPTSGLLLLVGGACLALRRRRMRA